MRPSGTSIRVDPTRLRAALERLATGDGGDDPSVLLGFVQLMMARACASPTGFESWLEGSLVVTIRRRVSCGVSVHVAGDADGRVDEAFEIPFARLPFGRVCGAIDREPAVVGPAFVYVTDDEVSISVISSAVFRSMRSRPGSPWMPTPISIWSSGRSKVGLPACGTVHEVSAMPMLRPHPLTLRQSSATS